MIKIISPIIPMAVDIYTSKPINIGDELGYQGVITEGVSGMTKYKNSTDNEEYFLAFTNEQDMVDLTGFTHELKLYDHDTIFIYHPNLIQCQGENVRMRLRQKAELPSEIPNNIVFYVTDEQFGDYIPLFFNGSVTSSQTIYSSSVYIAAFDNENPAGTDLPKYWDYLTNYFDLVIIYDKDYEDIGFTIDLGSEQQVGSVLLYGWGDSQGVKLQALTSTDGESFDLADTRKYNDNGALSIVRMYIDDTTRYIRVIQPLQSGGMSYRFIYKTVGVFAPLRTAEYKIIHEVEQ